MMAQILKRQVVVVPLLKRLGLDDLAANETPTAKGLHALRYSEIHDDTLQAITDPRLNLIFVHVNVPHLPAIYDVSGDSISTDHNATYLGNLRLVDRTLGDIRKTLEKAGMWDTSTILLTGDHPLRALTVEQPGRHPALRGLKQHHQVPYLLRMPGETQGVVYNTPVNTIVTKDLLIAIMNGQVATSQQIAAWLDRHPPHL
jgi:arylsulfatase A-like enzyme